MLTTSLLPPLQKQPQQQKSLHKAGHSQQFFSVRLHFTTSNEQKKSSLLLFQNFKVNLMCPFPPPKYLQGTKTCLVNSRFHYTSNAEHL